MNANQIKQNLLNEVEHTITEADGTVWGSVYLDNAKPRGMNAHQFAGFLSALESQNVYRRQGDNFFGYVKIEPVAAEAEGFEPVSAEEQERILDAECRAIREGRAVRV